MTSAPLQSLEVSPPSGRPHPALSGLVGAYHGYRHRLPGPGVHRGLPSSVMTVVFAFDEPLDVGWFRAPDQRDSLWTLASGLHTEAAEIRHQGLQCGIQLGLTAEGARQLLGMPMRELARRIVCLDDVLGSAAIDWHQRLLEQTSWQQRYAVLDDLLIGLARHNDDSRLGRWPRAELTWSWNRIQAAGGRERIGSMAHELGWSRRHLTERFAAEFGLTPKQLARVTRFERSKAGLFACRPLAGVAADCGYADQAHLSREWRAMAGYSPREWQQVELPFLQDLWSDDTESGAHE
jgi:AraC-like DNA-binding protein